ncbi:hypothetical protein [Luteimonas kalidii]|uniref:HAMP domain-containing histidine kinase n=1 Tax=Luteimonas kalidii TaxID=3042025 RepID=A0ABT6JVV5_9GAMM|nr:hypothetical protein [Luteimonas kalidii]MDH5834834.1 hypothetical protein [Luteimonas kalidii]
MRTRPRNRGLEVALGPFIVSGIVKAHDGRIRAGSDDGFTAFHIELPRH